MASSITVHKCASTYAPDEEAIIHLKRIVPRSHTADELAKIYGSDARIIVGFLSQNLPAGTIDVIAKIYRSRVQSPRIRNPESCPS